MPDLHLLNLFSFELWDNRGATRGSKGKLDRLEGRLKSFDKRTGYILKSLFSSVFEALIDLKKDDYTRFPILLQNLEAKFVLDNNGKKLMKQGIKFLTIHDSIVVNNTETLQYVEDMMKDEFQKQFGFVPNFKRD